MARRVFVVNSRHVVFEPLSGAFLFIYYTLLYYFTSDRFAQRSALPFRPGPAV